MRLRDLFMNKKSRETSQLSHTTLTVKRHFVACSQKLTHTLHKKVPVFLESYFRGQIHSWYLRYALPVFNHDYMFFDCKSAVEHIQRSLFFQLI